MCLRCILFLTCLIVSASNASAEEENSFVEAMEEYFDFVDYGGAVIFSQQIPAEDWGNLYIIDTRGAAQYKKDHIPGAINIEWPG
jgi:3-mercaptopyruvate sulfurtransferase SseA